MVERLRAAAGEGRLATEELEERVSEALAARTHGDLDRLLTDLPGPRLRRTHERRDRSSFSAQRPISCACGCPPNPFRGSATCVPPRLARPLARDGSRPDRPQRDASDGRRRDRRDRRPHDPHRRPVAGRLRLVQLPRLRPRPRDHRRDPGLPRRLGHPPELVAAARQPGALRADRGAADRAARLRGHARPADDHPHPHVGDPAARRLGHDLPRRARAQDDLRRLPGRPGARRRGAPLPLRGPRPPRRAARAPSATRRASSAWTASTA